MNACQSCDKPLVNRRPQTKFCNRACQMRRHRRRVDPGVGSAQRRRSQTRPLFETRQVQAIGGDLVKADLLSRDKAAFSDDPRDPLRFRPREVVTTGEFVVRARQDLELWGKPPLVMQLNLPRDLSAHRKSIYHDEPLTWGGREIERKNGTTFRSTHDEFECENCLSIVRVERVELHTEKKCAKEASKQMNAALLQDIRNEQKRQTEILERVALRMDIEDTTEINEILSDAETDTKR